jgi:hypothetical protein
VYCVVVVVDWWGAVVRPPGRSLHQVTQRKCLKRHKRKRKRSNKGIKRD